MRYNKRRWLNKKIYNRSCETLAKVKPIMYEVCVYEDISCKLFTFNSYDAAVNASALLAKACGVKSVEIRDHNDNVVHEYRGENFIESNWS